MKILKFYRAENQKEPFREWLSGLKDVVGIAHINKRLERLSCGQRGDSEPVGEGVFELRIHHGPGYRVYYAEHDRDIVILLHGGSKKSQHRDIDRAISYWKDYLEQYYERNKS